MDRLQAVEAVKRWLGLHPMVGAASYLLVASAGVVLLAVSIIFLRSAWEMHGLVPGYNQAKTDGLQTVCSQPTRSNQPCLSFRTGRVVAEDSRRHGAAWSVFVSFEGESRPPSKHTLYVDHHLDYPIGSGIRIYYIAKTPFAIVKPEEREWSPLHSNPKQQRHDDLVIGLGCVLFGMALVGHVASRKLRARGPSEGADAEPSDLQGVSGVL